ncbi:hypothetical protein PFISCL1PPCAC_4424, partial [Pristionchus fissidentatus]
MQRLQQLQKGCRFCLYQTEFADDMAIHESNCHPKEYRQLTEVTSDLSSGRAAVRPNASSAPAPRPRIKCTFCKCWRAPGAEMAQHISDRHPSVKRPIIVRKKEVGVKRKVEKKKAANGGKDSRSDIDEAETVSVVGNDQQEK